jgi:zinc transport system substrate-binding protein
MNKFLLSFFLLLSFSACGRSSPEAPKDQKPLVLVSLAPYQYLTERVAGDVLHVRAVVPQDTNPHGYEPSTQEMRAIKGGALWFRIGEFFEEKLLTVLQQHNPEMIDIDLREGISLLHNHTCCHHASSEDRHIWLSPRCAIIQTQKIADTLSEKFPEHKELFAQNAIDCIRELEDLDMEIKEILKPVSQRTFFVSHSAFAYFCEEYDLTQISIEFHGKEPTSAHLTQIIQDMGKQQTKLAVSMPQHSNKGLEIISEKLDLQVCSIDPYAPNILDTMRLLAHTIAET